MNPRTRAWRLITRNGIGASLLLVTLFFSVTPTNAQAECDYFVEDFDAQASFVPPASCWYTFSGGTSATTPTIAFEGGKSLSIPTGQNPNFDYSANGNACPGTGNNVVTTNFALMLDTLPSTSFQAGYNVGVFSQTGGQGPSAWLSVNSAGVLDMLLDTTAAGPSTVIASTTVSGFTLAPDVWYEIAFAISCNASTSDYISVVVTDTTDSSQYGAALSGYTISGSSVFGSFETAGTPQAWLDSLEITGLASPLEALSPTDTVAITSGVGLDLTKNGEYVIARTNSGDFVRIYDTETLTAGFSEDTNCAISNGIASLGDAGFAYFTCGGTTANTLKLISPTGAVFPFNACLDDCSEFDGTIDLLGLTGEQFFSDIHDLTFGEITTLENTPEDGRMHEFFFAISGTNGNIYGLDVGFWETDSIDGEDQENVTLAYSTTVPQDICSNHALKAYIVDEATTTRGYTFGFDSTPFLTNSGVIIGADLNPTISQSFTGASTINSAEDIACNANRILVSKPVTGASLVNPTTGTTTWNRPGTFSDVTLSYDLKWGSLTTSGTTEIVNAADGIGRCSLTHPAGTYVDSVMDNFGQRFVIMTTTNIAYYDIHECTTVTPVGGGTTTTTTPTSTSTTTLTGPAQEDDNALGSFVNALNTAWGFDWSWIIGAMLMLFVLIPTLIATHGNILAGSAVCFLVTVANVKFGLWPEWTIFAFVFVILFAVTRQGANNEEPAA